MEIDLTNTVTSLVGMRNSGKSVLLKYLVKQYLTVFDKIYIFCPSLKTNTFYKELTDDKNVFDTYNEEFIFKLMEEMNKSVEKGENKRVLLILDDMITDINFSKCKSLKIIATRGRHMNISLIFTTQHIKSIPPVVRGNCNNILVGQQSTASVKILCDECLYGGITRKEFMTMFYNSTNDYNFLVINTSNTKTNDISLSYGKIRTPENEIK